MIANPLQLNDWEIKKFLKVILGIQLAVLGVIGLDEVGLQIPIIRQLVGFIYLTFIPGIIILRILKLHKLGNIETLLYTVGLSVAFVMFTGLFMNTVYPFFGISGPISTTPLIITISAIVLLLCVLSYARDKDFSDPSFIDVGGILSPPVLFLCLFPFLAVLGAYLVNFYHNNLILMFLIVIIALVVVLIAFDKFIPKNLYPLAVFIIAISLLFYRSLISMYLVGWDIQIEYYLSNLVKFNSIWYSATSGSSVNSMLSIVMLAPAYSIVSNMDIAWVFKIIYPLLFSFVPLGLYRVFQKQTNDKIAFLSVFFFMSILTFYTELLEVARQQIAELFLVLLILPMIDKNMDKIKRSFLFIVFGFSLTVSHYGVSYIYMFSLIAVWLILFFAETSQMRKLKKNLHLEFKYKYEKVVGNPISSKIENTISSTFVLLFITFTLAWYMYVSISSSIFISLVSIGNHIASSIFTEFLNPEAVQGLNLIIRGTTSPLYGILKYLNLIAQFFIVVGVLTLLLKRNEMKFEREYEAFSLINFGICLGGITLPYFASSLNTTRLYHITLIFLAPFCVIGGITVFRMLSRMVKASWTDQRVRSSLEILSVFFAIFLLFNSGFVHEAAKDYPMSISLNSTVGYPRFNDQEILTGEWLKSEKNESVQIYSDANRGLLLLSLFGKCNHFIADETRGVPTNVYIFFGRENVKNKKIVMYPLNPVYQREVTTDLKNWTWYNTLLNMSKVYDNGDGQVYYR